MSLTLAEATETSRRKGSTKAKHKKARTGCDRCKSRRVKCDEGKPACQRCRSLGMHCPGYSMPKPRIFGLSQNDCFTSDFDKFAFDSFLAEGNNYILGYQPSSAEFWFRLVPQLTEVHTPIRHAIIALGLLQEPVRRSRGDSWGLSVRDDVKAMMLYHFNMAIRDFVQLAPYMSIEAKLACCVLFTATTMRSDYSVAVPIHTAAADKLLSQHEREVASGLHIMQPLILHQLKPLCQRLLLDAATFKDGYQDRTLSRSRPYEQFADYLFERAVDFHDHRSVWEYVSALLKYSLAIHFGDIDDYSILASHVRMALTELSMNMEFFYSRPYQHTPGEAEDYHIYMKHTLMIHWFAIRILAHTKSWEEDSYDCFTDDFVRILELGDLLVSMGSNRLSTTLGIIPPLFLAATKCRQPHLRYKAVQLIHDCKRFERAWSSCTAFQIARFLIEEEERSHCHANNLILMPPIRVCLTGVSFDQETKLATVKHEIRGANGTHYSASFTSSHEYVLSEQDSSGVGFLTDRIVQAAGFSGINLRTPTISCHCAQT